MTDLSLIWDDVALGADLAVTDGALVTGGDLRTAIIVSLFTDAPAPAGAALPDPADTDPRGWWGDALAETAGDVTGSTLWLLARAKRLPATLRAAEEAAASALAWLTADAVADAVGVRARFEGEAALALEIAVTRGAVTDRWSFVWSAP